MPIFRKGDLAILFAHIPKTGGTSIENAFKAEGWTADYLDGKVGKGTLNYHRVCTPQHMHAEMLKANFRFDRFDAIFAFVREPIARFRSEYVWQMRKKERIDTSAAVVERWAIESFARGKLNPYLYGNHLRPQHEFLLPKMEMLRFEDGLAEGLATLAAKTGLELPTEVPREKDSSTHYKVSSRDVELSGRAEKLARAFYRRDFRVLGYR